MTVQAIFIMECDFCDEVREISEEQYNARLALEEPGVTALDRCPTCTDKRERAIQAMLN